MTKLIPGRLVIINFAIFLVSCSGSTDGNHTGYAILNWEPPTSYTNGQPLEDLSGYKIYYSSQNGLYADSVLIDNPGTSSYVIENLPAPNHYYFAISAVNSQNVESNLSNIVGKNIR